MRIWDRALASPEPGQQPVVTAFGRWQTLVGVSSALAWQQFMAALLRVQCEVCLVWGSTSWIVGCRLSLQEIHPSAEQQRT